MKNKPILRWNVDCSDAGWPCDHGVAGVRVRIAAGTLIHTFVVYMNPLGISDYSPSNPPRPDGGDHEKWGR